eukprot:Tbor_TRINITY_DN5725_c3_g1::TRINITY_DN5725_c3_g1_i1::g.19617::m.19617
MRFKLPLIVYAVSIYTLTLIIVIAPPLALYAVQDDEEYITSPPTSETPLGSYLDDNSSSIMASRNHRGTQSSNRRDDIKVNNTSAQMTYKETTIIYLVFMVPIAVALNTVFLYCIHYRQIREQFYRVELTEMDNLAISTTTQSMFALNNLRNVLLKYNVEPLVFYENQKGNPTSSIVGEVSTSKTVANGPINDVNMNRVGSECKSYKGTHLPIEMSSRHRESSILGVNGRINTTARIINTDVECLSNPSNSSEITDILQSIGFPHVTSQEKHKRSAFPVLSIASDVHDLVTQIQLVNERAFSLRKDIVQLYTEIFNVNDIEMNISAAKETHQLDRNELEMGEVHVVQSNFCSSSINKRVPGTRNTNNMTEAIEKDIPLSKKSSNFAGFRGNVVDIGTVALPNILREPTAEGH